MNTFEMFGIYHFIIIIFVFAIILLLYLLKNKIKTRSKLIIKMRYSLAIIHLIFELSYYIYAIITKRSFLSTFPLELCAIALYLTFVFLITDNEFVWKISYPLAIIGGIITLFLGNPDDYGFLSYRFFHFFVGHGLLIFSNLFGVWILGYKMNFKDYKKFIIILLGIVGFTYIIDLITGANFMYLRFLPTPVDFFSTLLGPIYIIPLILIFALLYYIPVAFLPKKINEV